MKIHSSMGMVTNSSSTIYTYTTQSSVDMFKVFVDNLFDAVGVEIKCDDVFNVEVVMSDCDLERYAEEYMDYLAYEDEDTYVELNPQSVSKIYEHGLANNYEPNFEMENRLKVTTKDGQEIEVNTLYAMFYHEEVYDG